jgi:hypothetical protein
MAAFHAAPASPKLALPTDLYQTFFCGSPKIANCICQLFLAIENA